MANLMPDRKWRVRLEFKAADCWVGVFWKATPLPNQPGMSLINVWVCLLPMVPIHLTWKRWRP